MVLFTTLMLFDFSDRAVCIEIARVKTVKKKVKIAKILKLKLLNWKSFDYYEVNGDSFFNFDNSSILTDQGQCDCL